MGNRRRRTLVLLAAISAGAALAAGPPAAVTPWKPPGVSSPQFESHAAFDPRNSDLYFVRSSPAFEGWRILVTHCTLKGWSEPRPPAFAAANAREADPYFTRDGGTLYFISTRTTDGVHRKDLDIWRVDRDAKDAWGEPVRLPEPVNSTSTEWFPRPSPDGWIYFGSNRPGGLGGNDIWRARPGEAGAWRVENLGPAINTPGDEYEALPSPDGERMIVMADGDLFESRRDGDGWSKRVRLPAEVNTPGLEVGAVFSPSGRSILFARDTKGPDSGEFFVYREGDPEAWPLDCRVR
jgi:Tol biopolymer transport system component